MGIKGYVSVMRVGPEKVVTKNYVPRIINAKRKVFFIILLGDCYLDSHDQEKCQCFEGWSGDNCDQVECPDSFCGVNGTIIINIGKCDSEDNKIICICNRGWSGDTCSKISCDNWKGCKPNGLFILS